MELYRGKSKIVCEGTNANTVILHFTDNATAFNGEKNETLAGKGAVCAAISHLIFAHLERNGIETHLLTVIDEVTAEVKKSEIIGVEVIVRNMAAGGFSKKYGVAEGTALTPIVVEFCLKSDKLGDPMINESQIAALGLASEAEVKEMTRQALRVNELLCALFEKAGMRLADFKLEFGRFENRLILCDEISPESCRLWDMETGKKLDKDRFRQSLGDVTSSYNEVLRRLANVY